ncbi:MAG: adenosylcobinamide-phosphate synthase CbiB [Gammaproteobacteria bacterium]|nr:MAG: adenosylcobinamide-phosphate synthase CbiB [Gammaproteobacteria bacterium]
MLSVWVATAAVLLDRWWLEPRRDYPLVVFGNIAESLEARFNRSQSPVWVQQWVGLAGMLGLLAPLVWLFALLEDTIIKLPLQLAVLYVALGAGAIERYSKNIRLALKDRRVVLAREHLSLLLGRDTRALKKPGIINHTVEAILQGGCEAILSMLFWFFVAGLPGVVTFRLLGVLHQMWGDRETQTHYFSKSVHGTYNLMNWIPARLTALSYCLLGNSRRAWYCWQSQAWHWGDANQGAILSAGAGALGIRLGGDNLRDGHGAVRAALGEGQSPEINSITAALEMVRRANVVWLLLAFVVAGGWRWL